jgi:ribonuclease HI
MNKVQIYVDGSYIEGRVGYGAVILVNGDKIHEIYGPIPAENAQGTRQVAGELVAVGQALRYCQAQQWDTVEVYFDYLGIQKWATGEWKANLDLTQRYAQFVRSSGMQIKWRKVKSHSGDYWNEYVDQLAKSGALSGEEPDSQMDRKADRQPEAKSAAPSSKTKNEANLSDPLLIELERLAPLWIAYLSQEGISVQQDKILNQQCMRFLIPSATDSTKTGYMDIYNTAKKRLNPYIHNIKDDRLKRRLAELWDKFKLTWKP